MARITIALGLALCALTFVVLLNVGAERITTAFVPMIFGIPIFISGVISLNPHRRRTWIRVALFVALIGGAGALFRVSQIVVRWLGGGPVHPLPTLLAVFLAILLLTFAAVANGHQKLKL